MSRIKQFDHVGVTVADLDTVAAFFVDLGLEVEGRTFLEGDFIDVVIGIPDSKSEIVVLRPPGGGTGVKLARFVRPDHEPGSPPPRWPPSWAYAASVTRSRASRAMVDGLATNGYGLVGGIG